MKLLSVGGALGKYFADGQWTIRIATLTNSTDKSRDVEVTCFGGETPQGAQVFSRIITLAPHSQRQVPFAARLEHLKTGLRAGNTLMVNVDYLLSDHANGQVIQRFSDNSPKILDTVFPLPLLGTENYGTPAAGRLLTNVFGTYQPMLSQELSYIPDRWLGYSVPKVVMIVDVQSQILRDSQVQAMLDWTRRGGILVLTGTESLPQLLHGQLAQAAGVMAVGVHTISSLNIKRDGGKAVGEFKLPFPMPMVELFATDAKVLYTNDSMPLITRRALGSGWVITLATPVAALSETSTPTTAQVNVNPNALTDVLAEINNAIRIKPSLDPNAFAGPGRKVLDQIGGDKGPARAVPVWLLLGLAAAVLLAGAAMRFLGRGELVWMVLTPLAVLLGLGIWGYAASRSLPVRLTHVGLVTDAGDGTVRVQEGFAYGAGKNKEVRTFTSGTTRGDIRDIGKPSAIGASTKTLTDGPLKLPDQLVEPNSTRAFFLEAMVNNPGLTAKFTFGPDGLSGSVKNDLGCDLYGVMLFRNNRTYRLAGTFPSGQTGQTAFSQKNLLGINEFITSESDILTTTDNARQAMIAGMLTEPSLNAQIVSRPMLLGYIDRSMLNPTDNNTIPQQGWSLVVWPVEIVAPPPGTKVAIPSGFVTVFHTPRNAEVFSTRFPATGTNATSLDIKVVLPPQIEGLRDAKGTLRLNISGWTYKVTLSGLKAGGGETVLATYNDPAGIQPEIQIADMAAYRNADGSYRFRLKFEAASGKPGENITATWILKSVDLALEGISK